MNNKILTVIFGTMAAMFKQLNELILAGCELPPEVKTYPTAAEALAKMEGTGETLDAAAILAGAPVVPPVTEAANIVPNAIEAPPVTEAPMVPPVRDPGTVVDSENLPWDERIHSSGRTFYKSKAANGSPAGAWKLKKGVSPVIVAQVKTELAGGQSAPPAGAGANPAPPVEETPAVSGEIKEVCTDIYTWSSLVEKATAAGVTPQAMAAACQKFGVAGIIELQDQSLLITPVGKELGL